jgi:hypothetical protein
MDASQHPRPPTTPLLVYPFGGFTLDPACGSLSWAAGRMVSVRKATAVLSLFMRGYLLGADVNRAEPSVAVSTSVARRCPAEPNIPRNKDGSTRP